jgi:hypothetical protein
MSRTSILILLGILVIITPFSGLPIFLRSSLAVIFGACVLGIGIRDRSREARAARGAQPSVESPIEPPQPPSDISPI